MQIARPIDKPGTEIHVHGKSQGYLGLPVRHDMAEVLGQLSPIKTTAWQPTPDELAALNAGAAVYIDLVCAFVIPMQVYVGEPPEPVKPLNGVSDEDAKRIFFAGWGRYNTEAEFDGDRATIEFNKWWHGEPV